MNSAYVYLQLYRLFDRNTPLKKDCGVLCDKACCKGDDCGMYLFPGENKVYELLNPDWCSLDKSDLSYTYNNKTKNVPILFCNGECDRYQRPLSCRIFPLTPYLTKDKKLEIMMDPRAKSICPISRALDLEDINKSFLNNIKPNVPEASLEGYFMALHAKSKFGKTTFAYNLIKEHYNGDMSKGLLIATEKGYKTLGGINAIEVTDFDYVDREDPDHPEDANKFGFMELVEELIENKETIPYRFIIIDTITALERYATQYVLSKQGIADGKRYKDITDIEWGKGYSLLAEAIYAQIEMLTSAGYGCLVIGHSKTKTIKQRDGFEYDFTGFNVQNKTADIIEREADIIMYGETTLGRKSKTDKSIVTERKLKFRSNGEVLCGARFSNFPEEIGVNPKEFLEAFEAGVASANEDTVPAVQSETKAPVKPKAEEQESEKPEEDIEVEETEVKSESKETSSEDLISDITDAIEEADLTNSDKKDLVKDFIALGVPKGNYKIVKDTDLLQEVLETVKEF